MPRRALIAPTDRILKKWDEVNRERKVLGIGSIDVHAYPYRMGPIRVTIFPYKVQLKAIRTHVLVPEPVPDDFGQLKRAIYQALRDCRVFISNYRWGDARDFRIHCENNNGVAIIGDELEFCEYSIIKIRVPQTSVLRLIYNGEPVFEGIGYEFDYKAKQAGLYRAEIYVNGKGWIFSNHIRLNKKEGETKLR